MARAAAEVAADFVAGAADLITVGKTKMTVAAQTTRIQHTPYVTFLRPILLYLLVFC